MRLDRLLKCQPSRREQSPLKVRETEEGVVGEGDECKEGGLEKEDKGILQDKTVEDMVEEEVEEEVVVIKGDGLVTDIKVDGLVRVKDMVGDIKSSGLVRDTVENIKGRGLVKYTVENIKGRGLVRSTKGDNLVRDTKGSGLVVTDIKENGLVVSSRVGMDTQVIQEVEGKEEEEEDGVEEVVDIIRDGLVVATRMDTDTQGMLEVEDTEPSIIVNKQYRIL